jgi:hypothetical protein
MSTFFTGRALPRRTVIKGLGATLALPLLDAMVPAGLRGLAARPIHRFQTFYVPNGMAMEYWTPSRVKACLRDDADFGAARAVPDQMLVLSGIKANWVYIHAGASGRS